MRRVRLRRTALRIRHGAAVPYTHMMEDFE